MLSVFNLDKSFPGGFSLKNISFTISDGKIAALIGPNGAGKSTLFKIISGFEKMDGGSVYYNGKSVVSPYENIVSYMPEYLNIYPDYYLAEFTGLMSDLTGCNPDNLLSRLKLKPFLSEKIKFLSKGYRQRVNIFAALLTDKPLIILDEPFGPFDPIGITDIFDIIREENKKGKSFFISIHQINYAQRIADYFVMLNEGSIVCEGEFADLADMYGGDSLEDIFIRALKCEKIKS